MQIRVSIRIEQPVTLTPNVALTLNRICNDPNLDADPETDPIVRPAC